MGRNKTPTSMLDAKGTFLSHPDRKRPNEPSTDRPIGTAPKTMTAEQKEVWKELVKQSCPGVLKVSDRLMFAVLVKLATKFYSNVSMAAVETAQLITLSSKFAMNPADRSRVQVEKPKESALSLFLKKKTKIDTHAIADKLYQQEAKEPAPADLMHYN